MVLKDSIYNALLYRGSQSQSEGPPGLAPGSDVTGHLVQASV